METKELYLSRSRISRAFEPDESLWDDEIERIHELFNDHIEELKSLNSRRDHMPEEEFRRSRSILSVALYGTYGSGKSSLLRTLVNQVNHPHLAVDNLKAFDRTSSLEVIDPSLLSVNTNFLYAFLANALEADARKHHGHHVHQGKESRIVTPVEQRFHNVSEYLQAIDDDRSGGVAEDHLNVSFHRLERHTSAFLLREKLDEFIDTLVDDLTGISGNSILLMPVDDADMLPDALVDTFRNIQLYLRHPRLVPIFTFTGRMAEELLRSNYEDKLGVHNKQHSLRKITEASSELTIAENLAVQYLGKLFPVRNRIKLNNAANRVLAAVYYQSMSKKSNPTYQGDMSDEKNKRTEVRLLLQTATTLLFGHHKWPIQPDIAASLHSATLRRQMQIIDAMDAADVRNFFPEPGYDNLAHSRHSKVNNAPTLEQKDTWPFIFYRATWSLLNVHRDVLKEFELNLDDLYSWSQEGLRRTVLTGVLTRRLERRRDLLNQWRYQGTERRSQMISLLALNAFRPTMAGEHAPHQVQHFRYKNGYSMSIRSGVVWFVSLWCGFYLPQILGRNRPNNAKGQMPDYEPVASIGWDLMNAPYRATREGLNNNVAQTIGILFLKPESLANHVNGLIAFSKDCSSETSLENYWDLVGDASEAQRDNPENIPLA